jgi:hypothetical protein
MKRDLMKTDSYGVTAYVQITKGMVVAENVMIAKDGMVGMQGFRDDIKFFGDNNIIDKKIEK